MPTTLLQPMSPSLPAAAIFPRPARFSVTEFNRLGDTGLFEGKRAFLLDGVIWEQGPMDTPHATALALTHEALRIAFGTGWFVRGQSPLHVDIENDPFPDLAVVAGSPRDFLAKHPTTAALVVEIADTSFTFDTTEKAERFATANVPDYWVLDLNARQLHVFRNPQPLPAGLGATAYRTHLTLPPADRVSPLAAPTASLLVSDLLP